jgi:hypothetical protein
VLVSCFVLGAADAARFGMGKPRDGSGVALGIFWSEFCDGRVPLRMASFSALTTRFEWRILGVYLE